MTDVPHLDITRLWQRLDWLYFACERIQQNQESLMASMQEVREKVAAAGSRDEAAAELVRQIRESVVGIVGSSVPPDVMARLNTEFNTYESAAAGIGQALEGKAPGDNPAAQPPLPLDPPSTASTFNPLGTTVP